MTAAGNTSSTQNARDDFYRRIDARNMTPLWEVLHSLVPPEPTQACSPAIWRWDEVKPYLLESGSLITAEEAVRRVLIFENPAMRGESLVTPSLYAGLQLILPHEVAPSHRHTQSALRFIVDGRGAYTAVDGERTTMFPGDFIITPSWTWHDHGNEGVDGAAEPVVWLDGLDIPIIRMFGAGFAENLAERSQAVSRPEGNSDARFAHNLLPVRQLHPGTSSPIFNYPYARSRDALAQLARHAEIDDWHGVKMRYANPQTGGWAMPTMGTCLQLLPAGFAGKPHRSTDGTVYSVVEGRGRAVIERGEHSHTLEFGPKDHFVVPSWWSLSLHAVDECVLFSFSDRPVHEALGLLREEFIAP